MGIGPILPGRLPSSLVGNRLRQNLQTANLILMRLNDQVASGQRFFFPSEAPAAAIRSIFLQRTIERKTQMQSNVLTDKSFLTASETSLITASDAINQAKAFLLASLGTTSTSAEKQARADELSSIIDGVLNTANVRFRGRYLFAGSESQQIPFERISTSVVRYNGDEQDLGSFADLGLIIDNNVDGIAAFGAISEPITNDVDPALTLNTRISDLVGGQGVELGPIIVTLDNGVPQTVTVDLSNAETIGDIETILEDAFAAGPLTLTVDIDPASNFGIRLVPSAGTVEVVDLPGSNVARDLGIESGPVATILGADINPQITLSTTLASLNAGAGIGATAGNGLFIVNGPKSAVVDIDGAVTVEDLFNILEIADLDLMMRINKNKDGLAISTRLSGADFSIGENNGSNAAGLGIRTMDGATLLSDLNLDLGVPVDVGVDLVITRRDASTVNIDLSGDKTVQDVIDDINAVDPGNLVASLNTVGNGISITDNSGVGDLIVESNSVSEALGLAGSETSGNPANPLIGADVNPQRATGLFEVLGDLLLALRAEDDLELTRLSPLVDVEVGRINLIRSSIGGRLNMLEDVENRLLDEEVLLQETLSFEFDADLTEVITQVAATQATLQATLQLAASSSQLSLFNFL